MANAILLSTDHEHTSVNLNIPYIRNLSLILICRTKRVVVPRRKATGNEVEQKLNHNKTLYAHPRHLQVFNLNYAFLMISKVFRRVLKESTGQRLPGLIVAQ